MLLAASKEDLETYHCPNRVHGVLVLLSFLAWGWQAIRARFLETILTGAGLLLISLVTKRKLGGADVKLMAAITWSIRIRGSLMALFVGALFALLSEGLIWKNKGRFAMIPYLTIGILGQLVHM